MVYRKSAGANNNRNYMLYVSIFFITVLTIVTFFYTISKAIR